MPDVLEAPIDIAPMEDAPSFEAEPVDPPLAPEGAEDQPPEGEEPQSPADRVTSQKPVYDPDTKKLDPEVKKALDTLHATDPKTAARIRNTLAKGEALRAELPGGVQQARQLKALFEDIGGEDGVRELREGNQQFDELGKQYKAADPAFIEDLVETDPEAFCKLAPQVYARFSKEDPAGFSALVAGTFVQHMQQNRVENRLDFLEFALSDVQGLSPKVVENLQALRAYFTGLQELAQKPINSPREPKVAPDSRETQLTQKEKELQIREWNNQRDRIHNSVFENNLKTLTGGKELSKDSRAAVIELYKANMQRNFTPKIRAELQKRIDNGDDKGYLRAVQAFYSEHSSKALKLALQHVRWDTGKPNAAAAAPKPGTPAAPPKPNAGYEWRQKMPTQAEMSPSTTTDMIKKGWAILKDGKKVQWKKF